MGPMMSGEVREGVFEEDEESCAFSRLGDHRGVVWGDGEEGKRRKKRM